MRKHAGKRNEDYLEAIYIISKNKRITRIKDIAKELQVRKPTVVSMIEKLSEDGYIEHEKYGDVYLTEKGITKAQNVYYKHLTLHSFLKDVLSLDDETANTDACNLEHYSSDETIKKLLKFIEFFLYISKSDTDLSGSLKNYFETGEYPKLKNSNNKIKSLSSVPSGNKVLIISVKCSEKIKNYFMSNGIIPGNKIDIIKNDQNSKTIDLLIDSNLITLNNKETENIDVEICK